MEFKYEDHFNHLNDLCNYPAEINAINKIKDFINEAVDYAMQHGFYDNGFAVENIPTAIARDVIEWADLPDKVILFSTIIEACNQMMNDSGENDRDEKIREVCVAIANLLV